MISSAPPVRVSPPPNGTAVGFTLSPSSSSTSRSMRIRCFASPPAPPGSSGASSLYEELGVRAGATVREIRAAYRRLARERHPDVAGAPAADGFVRLHRAYATLSDPDTRARYDRAAAAAGTRRWWGGIGTGGGYRGRPRRTWETDQCW